MPSDTADNRERAIQASSFGTVAAAYERGRPPYPPEAVNWLLQGAGHRVLDLGAGTGKLARQLSSRGLDVTAVEPSPGMREQLAAAVPRARALEGTAESIPLPDGSMDAVLVAQAWHWVDPRRAIPEVARVLVPGGVLGLVWNVHDERDDWNAQLSRILHPGRAWSPANAGVRALAERADLFGMTESFTVEWQYALTRDELVDLVSSNSYVITMRAAERANLLAKVRKLAAHHRVPDHRTRIDIPYLTHCFRTSRRGAA
jgi:SAM-dependent methyltransferase